MLLTYHQELVPYATGIIQMVPAASGFVPSSREDDFGDAELAYSTLSDRHKIPKLHNKQHETVYTWNRRPISFGMSDVGSYIDIYI